MIVFTLSPEKKYLPPQIVFSERRPRPLYALVSVGNKVAFLSIITKMGMLTDLLLIFKPPYMIYKV